MGVGAGPGPGSLTVTVQVASFPSATALMVTVPAFIAAIVPSEDTVAMLGSDVVHVTVWTVASEGVTVATSFAVLPDSRETDVLSRITAVTCMTFQWA